MAGMSPSSSNAARVLATMLMARSYGLGSGPRECSERLLKEWRPVHSLDFVKSGYQRDNCQNICQNRCGRLGNVCHVGVVPLRAIAWSQHAWSACKCRLTHGNNQIARLKAVPSQGILDLLCGQHVMQFVSRGLTFLGPSPPPAPSPYSLNLPKELNWSTMVLKRVLIDTFPSLGSVPGAANLGAPAATGTRTG